MNKNICCDIIKDLLPGYIDGILSEAGTEAVKKHLEECSTCSEAYLEMKEEWHTGPEIKDRIALDGFKKVKRRTRMLKITAGIVTSLLVLLLLSLFVKVFVAGAPLATHELNVADLSYDEESNCLTINGTVNLATCRVSRVVWEQDKEDENNINIIAYGAETLPFQSDKNSFRISVPDMKGKTAYFAGPGYDRREVYNWKHYHYEKMIELENEIYDRLPGLDQTKDALNYTGGIETVNGTEGILFSVTSVIGENATFWTFNDQIITDGDFESRDFEVWISLESPYQILLLDYQTGAYTDDTSIIAKR